MLTNSFVRQVVVLQRIVARNNVFVRYLRSRNSSAPVTVDYRRLGGDGHHGHYVVIRWSCTAIAIIMKVRTTGHMGLRDHF